MSVDRLPSFASGARDRRVAVVECEDCGEFAECRWQLCRSRCRDDNVIVCLNIHAQRHNVLCMHAWLLLPGGDGNGVAVVALCQVHAKAARLMLASLKGMDT